MAKTRHADLQALSAEARALFPKAKLVITLEWDDDDVNAEVVVRRYAAATVEAIVRTNLQDVASTRDVPGAGTLLPDGSKNQVLDLTLPDATVQTCFTRPRWFWTGVVVS